MTPDATLLAILQLFVQADTWWESYQLVDEHPELLADNVGAALAALVEEAAAAGDETMAGHLAEHLALLRQARAVGVPLAFAEKMGVTAEELRATHDAHVAPAPFAAHTQSARAATTRYRHTGDAGALAQAIAAWEAILSHPGFPDAPEWFQLAVLNNAGGIFLDSYGVNGRLADLDRALELWQAAVQRTPADSPLLAGRLNNLGHGLRARYDRTGMVADLEDALSAYERALALSDDASPERAIILGSLGNGLHDRYLHTSHLGDLDAAITSWEAALRLTQDDSAHHAKFLNNLANGLHTRYTHSGLVADLDRAIVVWEEAVAATAANPPLQASYLNNLADGLFSRYQRTEQGEDLDTAIQAWNDAIARTPSTSLALAGYLHNLANGLRACFARHGQAQDLEAALQAHREAVRRAPEESPDYALYLNSLGNGLHDRFLLTGQVGDLDEAIRASQYAVDHTVPSSPLRPGYLSSLASALRMRYTQTGQVGDLDAAIRAYETAVHDVAADSPARADLLNGLGNGLWDRYARTGQAADLDAAITAYEAAAGRAPAASHLTGLANALHSRYERTRELADLEAAITAWRDALQRLEPQSYHRPLVLGGLGLGLHSLYEQTGQLSDLEASIATCREAVQGMPDDSPDRVVYLHNLGLGLHSRYALTRQLTDLDEAIAAWQEVVDQTPPGSPNWGLYVNSLGVGLLDRYARTGSLEDLEAALEAYRRALRHGPASERDRVGFLNNVGVGLRECYARTGQPADGDAAAEAYLAAVDGLDSAMLDSPVAFLIGQQAQWADLYAGAVDALAAVGRPAEALATAEGSKSRLLAGLVGRGDLPAPVAIPAKLAARERELAAQLSAFDAAELAGRGTANEARRAVTERVAIIAGLRAVWADIAARGPDAADYVAVRRGDRLPAGELARLAGALEPGEALLSLFITVGRTLLFLWPASAPAPLMIEAALDADELRYDFLASYQDEIVDRAATRQLGRPLNQRWRALGRPLLGLLLPHLAGLRRLVIAPESAFHQLPLHALWLSDAEDTLLDHCAVSYVPSLSLLERLWRREPRANNAALGAAVLGYTPNDDPQERARFLGEAAAVAERVGVVPRLDDKATGTALEAATTFPLRLLHLSCHGAFDDDDTLRSGVLLADGVYTARRFLTQRLPVDLVTLSACETALSGSLGGDEMAGLSLALLTAGARSLLLGLWSVSAETTEQMMVDFYERLWGVGDLAIDKAEALRQTMLALRDGHLMPPRPGFDPRDPYYWAPFVLVGDWR